MIWKVRFMNMNWERHAFQHGVVQDEQRGTFLGMYKSRLAEDMGIAVSPKVNSAAVAQPLSFSSYGLQTAKE